MESPVNTESTKTPAVTSPDESGSSGPVTSTGSRPSASAKPRTPAVKVNQAAGTAAGPDYSGLLDRDRLLSEAGITPTLQAKAVRQAWNKKMALLEAQRTQYFAHEGIVTDERTTPDNRTQLDATESVDRMLGVIAPKAEQKVQITYKLELPDWSRPDSIVDIQAVEVEVAHEQATDSANNEPATALTAQPQ